MKHLQLSEFFGETNRILDLGGIVLTDTEYTHSKVDWHYHENMYFTFILQGLVLEGNKKELYTCSPGSLLFHNWQEQHYNIKPDGFTRGFHIELVDSWFKNLSLNTDSLQGNINISNPEIKLLFYKIFKESKQFDDTSMLSIQAMIIEVFSKMNALSEHETWENKPQWVLKIKELLHDEYYSSYSLQELAQLIGIHPVHLSRHFPKYFHCTMGQYIRNIRVGKALSLLANKRLSITDIAYQAGFADQSHLIRCFKDSQLITPFAYKKLMHGK